MKWLLLLALASPKAHESIRAPWFTCTTDGVYYFKNGQIGKNETIRCTVKKDDLLLVLEYFHKLKYPTEVSTKYLDNGELYEYNVSAHCGSDSAICK